MRIIAGLCVLLVSAGCVSTTHRYYSVPTSPDDRCYRRCERVDTREQFAWCLEECPGAVAGVGRCGCPTPGFTCETVTTRESDDLKSGLVVGGILAFGFGLFFLPGLVMSGLPNAEHH
jgi:hypothetical protein